MAFALKAMQVSIQLKMETSSNSTLNTFLTMTYVYVAGGSNSLLVPSSPPWSAEKRSDPEVGNLLDI